MITLRRDNNLLNYPLKFLSLELFPLVHRQPPPLPLPTVTRVPIRHLHLGDREPPQLPTLQMLKS